MANQYQFADLGIITAKQNASFERYWTVSVNFDMSQAGLTYKAQARKSFGNKAVVLDFVETDGSFVVDVPNKTIGLVQDSNDMNIEPGDHVFDIRVWTDANDAIYLGQGILRILPSATIV